MQQVAQPAHPLGALGVGQGDHAALPRRDGLDRVEGEHGGVRVGVGPDGRPVRIRAAQGVAGVLDHGRAMAPRDLRDRGGVAQATRQVDRQHRTDRAGPVDGLGDRVRRGEARLRIDVGEDGLGVKEDDLKKMDLPTLKILSRNAQALPTIARATYTGTGIVPDENEFAKMDATGKKIPLTGVELLAAVNAKNNGGATLAEATAKQLKR